MSLDLVTDYYVTPVTDSAVYADVRFGDNGFLWGMGEYLIGTPTVEVVGTRTWEGEPFQGPINSGWFEVQMHVRADGHTTWYVLGGENGTLDLWVDPLESISEVKIQAAAETMGLSIEWRSLLVRFYKDGAMTQMVDVYDQYAPKADTTMGTGLWSNQQILTVEPSQSDNNEVIVTGLVYLHVDEWFWPYGTELFGRIAIYD